ncbi:NiFe hydrogenase [Paramagnetospirillum caucaseum]|uniref:NiFe hydrogenase n=1 Tax=Paramagnetospirillum caucaseum TaxID=1244869 RepID=M2Z726_9PROT|nr:hydrogenase maturation protease [Paramagnetospirillum caucaseum]EME70100.1 NiFe hydrogenase [Paramagnetospirillum caucaseum]
MTAPTLIFGWGNPSRGDDALGPALLDAVEALRDAHPEWGPVELLTDFQLQVEHALDLEGRDRVLFVDASAAPDDAPFRAAPILPAKDASFTSHALSPQGVMHVFTEIKRMPPPPCTLLAIAGEAFELGEPLSAAAQAHLDAALAWTKAWLAAE